MPDNPPLTSLQNPLIKHLVKLRLNRDYRYEQHSLIVEGAKPVAEVAPYIKKLFYLESARPPIEAPEAWPVSEAVMHKISGMTSPEGVIAETRMPEFGLPKNAKWVVALDGINDPGNMGTLLRTALAFGWQGVFILPSSCDPFNEKAIRAARGAHFRIPLAFGSLEDLKNLSERCKLKPFVAELEGISPENLPMKEGKLLVLGNEAHGASQELHEWCTKITLPMPGEMESLNVAIAGGILMYLLRRPS